MSWWLHYKDRKTGEILKVERFEEGGTYPVGGLDIAEVNITYNYGKYFPFGRLNKKTGKEALRLINRFIKRIEDKSICPWCNKKLIRDPDRFLYYCPNTKRFKNSGCPFQETDLERELGESDYWHPTRENVLRVLKLLKSWFGKNPNGIVEIH